MTALNDALWAALAKGHRPFKCWSCKEWFVETEVRRGRARLTCLNANCQYARARYMAFGVLPGESQRTERSMMTRAVLRAIEADWLTDREIAEDLGCTPSFVNCVREKTGRNKFKIRRSA